MSAPTKQQLLFSNSNLTKLALLIGIGLILFLFESLLPRPLPWLKPGLAHVATLIALFALGNRAALVVVTGRVLLGSLLLGTFFNPAFVLSLGSGLSATLAMILLKRYCSRYFSIFGISIAGAVVHNISQLILVELIIVKKIEIFYLLPLMIFSALFTGFLVGLVSYLLISRIQALQLSL